MTSHRTPKGAIDFTTVEVWTRSGLVTFCLLFVMELKTRRVHLAGKKQGLAKNQGVWIPVWIPWSGFHGVLSKAHSCPVPNRIPTARTLSGTCSNPSMFGGKHHLPK